MAEGITQGEKGQYIIFESGAEKYRNHRGKYPIGVTIQPNGKFLARVGETRQRIGIYDSPIEAFNAYKNAKERLIRNVAEKYFQEGKITEKVYNALMKYEVEITD